MSEHALTRWTDGVWLDTDPVRIIGTKLTATMAVIRLRDDELLLYSPLSLTTPRRAAIEALGAVAHLYAPNLYHHMWVGEWAEAFPAARLHAPAGLADKRPDLRIDRVTGTPEPAFAGLVDEVRIEGSRLGESVLVHRPSRTLFVADLVHNVGHPTHGWTRLYTKMMGFHDRVGLSRMIRWTAFPDHAATRRSLDALLELPFERVVVGHGAPIEADAKQVIAGVYAWL